MSDDSDDGDNRRIKRPREEPEEPEEPEDYGEDDDDDDDDEESPQNKLDYARSKLMNVMENICIFVEAEKDKATRQECIKQLNEIRRQINEIVHNNM